MPRCKGCGRPIKWVKTPKGKSMPLDPDPVKMVMVRMVEKKDLKGNVVSVVETGFSIDAYMPHWATCPKADKFKRKKNDTAKSRKG